MSDRDVRCVLVLFAAASMLLVACPRREPLVCGAQESCPRGFVCSEGICIKDRDDKPDACAPSCDNGIDRCPSEPPADEEVLVALVDLTCNYGEECCCGVCRPSKICSALAGEELGCFLTDWCLNPSCQEP